uniref:Transmembrane protein 17 n=1 Tax=Falco tinnunculus TaxID=100819 RepID=A0A8C4UJI0_FALTI
MTISAGLAGKLHAGTATATGKHVLLGAHTYTRQMRERASTCAEPRCPLTHTAQINVLLRGTRHHGPQGSPPSARGPVTRARSRGPAPPPSARGGRAAPPEAAGGIPRPRRACAPRPAAAACRCPSPSGGSWAPSAAPSSPTATAPARTTRLAAQYPILSDYYKFILVTIMILASLIEVIRLYLGYMGNLQEKVPELAGFWLLSLLLQLPIILFLLFNEGLRIQPLERAVNMIFALFLTFQVIAAFVTLKRMANKLATQFRLREFDQLKDHPVPDFYSLGKEARAVPMAGRDPSAGWGSHTEGLRS